MTAVQEKTVTVKPVAGHIGANIEGIDISQTLDETTLQTVKNALYEHKVIFFRDQDLDHASQIAFGRQFGELTYAHPHDDAPPTGFPEIFTIDPRRYEERYGQDFKEQTRKRQYSYFSGWHTDVTAAVNPPAASILRAEVVPEVGGDTTWTNLVAAYNGLSRKTQDFVDGLRAEHRYGGSVKVEDGAYAKRVNDNLLVAEHPVVRVHPVTHEKGLFVNPASPATSLVSARVRARRSSTSSTPSSRGPSTPCGFRWETGSVAVWDNRATAHLAPRDLEHMDVQRTLHRVTVIGDTPVGPDGRESTLLAGRPFTADHAVVVD